MGSSKFDAVDPDPGLALVSAQRMKLKDITELPSVGQPHAARWPKTQPVGDGVLVYFSSGISLPRSVETVSGANPDDS